MITNYMGIGVIQERSGLPRLPAISSMSKAAPRHRTSHVLTQHLTIYEDAEHEAHENTFEVVRLGTETYLRHNAGNAKITRKGIPDAVQGNDFRGTHVDGRQKRMTEFEIESHLSKAPRRKTIYIPSDDTTIFTIHPGAGKQTRTESIAGCPNASSKVYNPIGVSSKIKDAHTPSTRSLRAAPRRASLMPVQACRANISTSTLRYGCGPGKENVPPGMSQEPGYHGKDNKSDDKGFMLSHRGTLSQKSTPEESPFPLHTQRQESKGRTTLNQPPTRRMSSATKFSLAYSQNLCAETKQASFWEERDLPAGPDVKAGRSSTMSSSLLTDTQDAGTARRPFRQDLQRPELYEDDWLAPQESMIVSLLNETFDECQTRAQRNAVGIEGPTRALLVLYQNDDNVLLYRRMQASLAFGALSLPQDRISLCSRLQTDVGLRQSFISLWLDNYNLEALAIALEVVLGREIGVYIYQGTRSHSPAKRSLKISKKKLQGLLSTSLLSKRKPAESEELFTTSKFSPDLLSWRKTFLKSLMVLFTLDNLKTRELFPGLLFRRTSTFKTSQSILTALGRLLLPSLGDIHRVVGHFGFEVVHRQAPLEEYKYRVENLATDFRDGIRLMRLIGSSRSSELKYPCPSRTQKLHNVRLSLEAMSCDGGQGDLLRRVAAEDIVDGHREKTIILLSSILGQLSFIGLLEDVNAAAELQRLIRRYRPPPSAVSGAQDQATLLERWASTVLAICGTRTSDAHQHLIDGRLIRATEQVYAPYLPSTLSPSASLSGTASSASNFLTTLALPRTMAEFLSPSTTRSRILPPSLRLPLLAFLCSRTLSISRKGRAASTIQSAWRHFMQRQKEKRMAIRFRVACARQQVVSAKARLEAAAITIQRSWRRYLRRIQTRLEKDLVQRKSGRKGHTGRRRETDIWTHTVNEELESDIWLA